MKTLEQNELGAITGGDTFARDAGQFLGGVGGWIQSHPSLYLLLGPGIGGLTAAVAGLTEASR